MAAMRISVSSVSTSLTSIAMGMLGQPWLSPKSRSMRRRLVRNPGLALQSCFVNDIDRGRAIVDDLALLPFAQDPAGVLARHIGQGSQVILANLVSDEQLARRRGGLSKVFGKLKQGACDACLERKEARGCYLVIGLPQTLDESGDEVTVHLRIVAQTFEEIAAGHEGQSTVSERLNGGRPWQSIQHCEFADDRSWSEDSEDPLCTLRRSYAHLENAFFEPIAAIAYRA